MQLVERLKFSPRRISKRVPPFGAQGDCRATSTPEGMRDEGGILVPPKQPSCKIFF